jgi:adenine-specific DNA-methyltransferase
MKKILCIISVLLCILLSGCGDATSIGIIGGADGPTSIIVAEKGEKAMYEQITAAGNKILEEITSETVDVAQYGESFEVDETVSKYKNLDVGFKVFKLDTSNLKTWDGTPIEDKQIDLFYERLNAMIDTVKDDRTDMDVVYEVMLKMGIPLDVEVQYMEINDKIAYIVGDFILMICIADKITAEDIEAMAQYAPAKIICAEAGFADDSALSNAHYILKDRAIELKLV